MPRMSSGQQKYFYTMPVPIFAEQINPASGVPYPAMPLTRDVVILSMVLVVEWTVQPTAMSLEVTSEGGTNIFTEPNPASATPFYAVLDGHIGVDSIFTTVLLDAKRPLFHGLRQCAITMNVVGGTVQNIYAEIMYLEWR